MSAKTLKFVMQLSKLSSAVTRRFSIHGQGLQDFAVLFHLNESVQGKMRRVDLAEKLGLTASGITRLLIPMEKIGLIKREADKSDARVSLVAISASGKRILGESMGRAETLSRDILSDIENQMNELIELHK